LTLALGIGINTSLFTCCIRLPSVRGREEPGSVVNVYQTLEGEFDRQVEGSVELLSYPEYVNYRDRVAGVSGLAASADLKLYLGGNNVERINGLMVTDNYFRFWEAEALSAALFSTKNVRHVFNVRSPFLVTVSGSDGLVLTRV